MYLSSEGAQPRIYPTYLYKDGELENKEIIYDIMNMYVICNNTIDTDKNFIINNSINYYNIIFNIYDA